MFPILAVTGERPDLGFTGWGLTLLGVAIRTVDRSRARASTTSNVGDDGPLQPSEEPSAVRSSHSKQLSPIRPTAVRTSLQAGSQAGDPHLSPCGH